MGDRFIICKRRHGREPDGIVPIDAIGRVGELVGKDGTALTLQFVNGVLTDDGELVKDVEFDETAEGYYLEKVKLITDTRPRSPMGRGTVLVDVDPAYDAFWGRFQESDPRRQHGKHLRTITESIEQDGMRHPIIFNRNMELRVGAYRLAAYKKLGRKKIEAYITDTDEKRTYRL